jgi:hypothetical protein
MKCQYKKFFFLFVKSNLFFLSFIFFQLKTSASTFVDNVIPPSSSLYLPTASLAAYNGLGAAAPGDYSSAEVNPAIMSALKKQYTVFGDTSWQRSANLVDFGVIDSTTTKIATLIRIRESIPNTPDLRDRRYTLGFSYQVPQTDFSLGLTMDYEQLTITNLTSSDSSNFFTGAGVLYELFSKSVQPIFLGIGINRIFDAYSPIQYDTGISTTFFDGFYTISMDALTTNLSGLQKIVGSMAIETNKFLDFKGSYGYLTREKKNVWAAGLFFRAPVLQLFYTFASSDSSDTTSLRQSAGCALNFAF